MYKTPGQGDCKVPVSPAGRKRTPMEIQNIFNHVQELHSNLYIYINMCMYDIKVYCIIVCTTHVYMIVYWVVGKSTKKHNGHFDGKSWEGH